MAGSGKPFLWEKTATVVHADCRIFTVLKSRFRHPARGTEGEFFVVDARDWVTVIAVTDQRELVTVRQFRFGIEDLTLEFPAGVMAAGEDPLQTGVRELREETGFAGSGPELLGWVYPNPAIQNNRLFVVAIHQVKRVDVPQWDEHEEIQTELVPAVRVPEMLARGDFRHALSVCALQFYEKKYSF